MDKKVIELSKTLPTEIQLCDPSGKPYEGEDVIPLDGITRMALAKIMLTTGQDVEATINDVLKSAIKKYVGSNDIGLDNAEDSCILDDTETATEGELDDTPNI